MSAAYRQEAPAEAAPELLTALEAAVEWGRAQGMAEPDLAGQLIRPRIALAGWSAIRAAAPPAAFWFGALAVQLAHEASLLHDDIVDGAPVRRGRPTVAAAHGIAAALVRGDHLLTTAYRYAARTGSPVFIEIFARAVERTVAGELSQARRVGRALSFEEWSAIARGKAGELLGCALALGPALADPARAEAAYDLGCRMGIAYQMLDDLLDFCPANDSGKPALSDYAQGHWTWPLGELGGIELGRAPAEVVAMFYRPSGEASPIRRCVRRIDQEIEALVDEITETLGRSPEMESMLRGWSVRAGTAVEREEGLGTGRVEAPMAPPASVRRRALPTPALLERIPAGTEVATYLGRHSRSFAFATRFLPPVERARVARVYAYCRCTDDLVDDPSLEPPASEALLEEWVVLSRTAYDGEITGVPFLDTVMGEMSAAGVPFRHVEELAEGMRMDLRRERFASMAELRRYTYRVASVVGLWIAELYGVRDPAVLRRAVEMGHAMQLTNILRDVGEDARAGRCYLPADAMARHGIAEEDLRRTGALSSGYAELIEEMIAAARTSYEAGLEGIDGLPSSLGRSVAIAAHVYRGILREIARNGYDNLTRRAHTSTGRKLALAARALLDLRRTSLQASALPAPVAHVIPR